MLSPNRGNLITSHGIAASNEIKYKKFVSLLCPPLAPVL